MKHIALYLMITTAVWCISLAACTKNDETTEEKGKIERITDDIAEDAVDYIQSPIDKAKAARDKASQRTEDLNAQHE
ncbi:MAG: hypothetical protein GY868_11085 [Deltaproteobacteria bacterium]|nr:hypothetical protein [Deltaproteobacteria bacterium]